jgi:mono/diheme cytochrome c family protein
MRWTSRLAVLMCALATAIWTFSGPLAAQQKPAAEQHNEGAHVHPEAAKLKNPVAANAASIETGKKVYTANCVGCHGDLGKGDGKMTANMNPKPPDLSDAEWKHGSSDGEIFVLIRDGAKGTPMRAFASKMTPTEMWSVVNYLRTLGPAPAKK